MDISAVVRILETAQCKDIDGLHCFEVNSVQFQDLVERVSPKEGDVHQFLVDKYLMDNFALRLSSLEKADYYVVTKGEPILDTLWKKKFRP